MSEWSSDVCSAVLGPRGPVVLPRVGVRDVSGEIFVLIHLLETLHQIPRNGFAGVECHGLLLCTGFSQARSVMKLRDRLAARHDRHKTLQIGRASCRERVCQYV